MDFQLTPDGDLKLGQQATDENGYPLFYISQSPYSNGLTTIDPNEDSIPVRDVGLISGYDEILQWMKTIFQTENPDWSLYPTIGANISDLAGELNTKETAFLGETMIRRAFSVHPFLSEENVTIQSVPISHYKIIYLIQLQKEDQATYDYHFILDLEMGVLNYYEKEEGSGTLL